MATKIDYVDESWNPVCGCRKQSSGCENCYAERMARRLVGMARADQRRGRDPGRKRHYLEVLDDQGRWNGRAVLDKEALEIPACWRKPRRVLVCSMSDLFREGMPASFIAKAIATMNGCPQHAFFLLSKRMDQALAYLEGTAGAPSAARPLGHIWFGASIEDQEAANRRRKPLERIARHFGLRTFVSYEPALGPVDWSGWEFIGSLIAGGETGPKARPSHPDWFRQARNWAQTRGIPFFFKSWGEYQTLECGPEWRTVGLLGIDGMWRGRAAGSLTNALAKRAGDVWVQRVGKKTTGRRLDGRTWDEIPDGVPRSVRKTAAIGL